MGLFDKKYCDVCGEKIGLLGNKKLEDANLCKKCAAKLSPWFNERRHSTLEEIKQQLAYREENKAEVAAFHKTLVLGRGYTKLLVDEDAGKFMITSARDINEANPDVLSFSQVTGVDIDIDEDRTEIMKEDQDGKRVSYEPKHYEYEYDFDAIVRVNHPYFDEMRFRLNDSSVETGSRSINDAPPAPGGKGNAGDVVGNFLGALAGGIQAAAAGKGAVWNAEYQEYLNLAEQVKAVLMGGRNAMREEAEAASAPKIKVTCPFCKATMIPDENGCCEYCGSALPKA